MVFRDLSPRSKPVLVETNFCFLEGNAVEEAHDLCACWFLEKEKSS